MRRKQEWASK